MALSILESRKLNKLIDANSALLNAGGLSIIESRRINKAIDADLALLNGGNDTPELIDEETEDLIPDGKDNEVKTAKGTKIVTGFMVVEASKLIISHDEQGNPNPDYPAELQPRDRARDTSQAQIARIAKNLDPDMLGRTRVAYQGAPIIGKDGVVESGNGRAMAITLAYKLGKADEYRDWLLDIADMYGLNPDKIKHMKRPVLVRVRKTDIDRVQFAMESNQSDMLAMTATEKAKSDANRLTDAIIGKLSIDGDLSAASNRDFIMGFLTSLGDDETAGLLTTGGQPTKQLYDRAQSAIFAKAYNDDRLLELMADDAKPEIANIIKSLNQAAPVFIRARAISDKATHDTTQKLGDAIEASLNQQAVDAIIKATEMLKKAKDSGMPIEELVKQADMFGEVDPVVAQMALFIKDNNRSPARMGAAFTAMAEFVLKELEHRQNDSLFVDEPELDMVDVLKAANSQLQKQYGDNVKAIGGGNGGFIDIFTETRGQKADREAFLAGNDEIIELTGKELGEFPDTPEGKKGLRKAANEALGLIRGELFPCPALGGGVEIRKEGIKKIISTSADSRKLKIIPQLPKFIFKGEKVGKRVPYDGDKDKSAIAYFTLRAEFTLAGVPLAARFVVKEDNNGKFHYDHSIYDQGVIFDSVSKTNKSPAGAGLESVTTSNGGGTYPSRLASHQLDSSVDQDSAEINDEDFMTDEDETGQVFDMDESINPAFDSASGGGRMVLNLFIEGEEPEYLDDDIEPETTNEPVPIPEGGTIAPPVVQSTAEGQDNPLEAAFKAELHALTLATDILTLDKQLDDVMERLDKAGLSEVLDAPLNEAVDRMTWLLAEAEKKAD